MANLFRYERVVKFKLFNSTTVKEESLFLFSQKILTLDFQQRKTEI